MAAAKRRCLLILNGRSTRGQHDRFCGWTNPPISEEGRQQMLTRRKEVIESGLGLPPVWYVSDRRRAVESFEIMTAGMRAPVIRLTKSLREMNFGDYENLTWEELPADFQRDYEINLQKPLNLRFPDGESFIEMCDRVSAGALEILSYEGDRSDVAILGHQGSLRIWHLMAHDKPVTEFFSGGSDVPPTAWLEISSGDVAGWRRRNLPIGATAE